MKRNQRDFTHHDFTHHDFTHDVASRSNPCPYHHIASTPEVDSEDAVADMPFSSASSLMVVVTEATAVGDVVAVHS